MRLCRGCSPFEPHRFFPFAGAKLSPLAQSGIFRFSALHVFAASHPIRVHAFVFCGTLPSLRWQVFVFFSRSHSPLIRRITFADLGTECPFVESLHFPACCNSSVSGFCRSILAGLNFLPPRSGVSCIRPSVQGFSYKPSNTSSCQFARVIPAPLWEVLSGLWFVQSSILSLLLIIRCTSFSEKFASVFPFRRRSSSASTVPVTIQRGSMFIRNCLDLVSHLLYLRYPQKIAPLRLCILLPFRTVSESVLPAPDRYRVTHQLFTPIFVQCIPWRIDSQYHILCKSLCNNKCRNVSVPVRRWKRAGRTNY